MRFTCSVRFPNPGEIDAFALALKLAKERDADIVPATDPDASRLDCCSAFIKKCLISMN